MQDWPLTANVFIEHAARWHGNREIVSRLEDGSIDRRTYLDLLYDARRLSNALLSSGVKPGDRVATLAMNGPEHLAAWYAISCIGAVCHTLNPRYSDEQTTYIINHAEDRIILSDGAFAPLLQRVLTQCPSVERVVFINPPAAGAKIETPVTQYGDFIAGMHDDCDWGGIDERMAAGLCYTSGTTGHPKGVLYSHRSNALHTFISMQPDALNLRSRDCILPVVPMYHANAWGLTFSAPAVGAKLVLPGHKLDGASICEMIQNEGVTIAAGVPTVWLALLQYMNEHNVSLPSLERVIVGGAAMSEYILKGFEAHGIEAIHAWGMTEMSPIGTMGTMSIDTEQLDASARAAVLLKQGRPLCGIDMRVVDDQGRELPRDGRAVGALQVRGGTICASYFKQAQCALNSDGYFDTGDISSIDAHGYMMITDRAKDVIKSGGEFISSIDIENAALTFPNVVMAAAVAIPHPKWDERPLLLVQAKPGAAVEPKELLAHLASRLPKHWLPDEIRFVASLPLGATGKIDKKQIRAALKS